MAATLYYAGSTFPLTAGDLAVVEAAVARLNAVPPTSTRAVVQTFSLSSVTVVIGHGIPVAFTRS